MKKNEIIEELKKMGFEAAWHTVNKNGVLHTGIVIRSQGQVAPIIYTKGLLNEGDSVDLAVNKILKEYLKVKDVSFDLERMTSREYILEHITVAVQREGTEPIIKRESGLTGIESYLLIIDSSTDEGNLSMKVNADLLKKSHISEKEAWEQAEKNLHESVRVESMKEVMEKAMGKEFVEASGVDDRIYVISTESGIKGASAVLDKKIMNEFAKAHKTSQIAVLPSSIHEMLLIPDTEGFCEEELSFMVESVNEAEVIPEERLTDRAYFLNF